LIELGDHPQGVVLPVKVQAGARRNGLAGEHAGTLKVQVTSAAERGKATEAVLQTIASVFGLRRSQVRLLSGMTSPHKRILIAGVSRTELAQRLRAELAAR
jgi:uncharacterized protein (TIGR00251 family)